MAQRESWLRVVMVALGVSAVVIVSSIALVRYQNRGRQVSPGIIMAADRLVQIPDSVVAPLFDRATFFQRRDEFATALREGAFSVDSVTHFYQSYVMWARDGLWDTSEVRQLGTYLGFSRP